MAPVKAKAKSSKAKSAKTGQAKKAAKQDAPVKRRPAKTAKTAAKRTAAKPKRKAVLARNVGGGGAHTAADRKTTKELSALRPRNVE